MASTAASRDLRQAGDVSPAGSRTRRESLSRWIARTTGHHLDARSDKGFCEGLYTADEMEFSYYQKDKMQKLVFLQKMMDITQMMNGENYNLNPKAIAAGKECDKTNAWLQGIYKAATSG